ncbi:hypothetical protein [Antarctobacter jejuensis]|uniref:hypothetical protein n=1 Tax=Antarctobacter jejuensis TaxID=1439938 RepID=UPI003FD0CB11
MVDAPRYGACDLTHLWTDSYASLTVSGVRDDPDTLSLNFLGLAGAEVARKARVVRAFPLVSDLDPHTNEHFTMDVLLPRVLAHDTALVLHGALVSRGDDAVCLIGDSGRGKSTLSAAMRGAGWAFHGDDALEIRQEGAAITARATYHSLRLFPDSLRKIFPEAPSNLPRMADYLDKRRLDPQNAAVPADTRLRAICVLGPDRGDGAVLAGSLGPRSLCMTLLAQSFALDPSDPLAAQVRLTAAGSVAGAMPGHALTYPRDYARLPEVIATIEALLDTALPSDGQTPRG